MILSHNVANAMTKLVAADALPGLLGGLVAGNLVQRNFEPLPEDIGTHIKASFRIPDVTKVLAVPDLLRLYMEPAIAALEEKIEGDLFALLKQSKEVMAGHEFTREDFYLVATPQAYQRLRGMRDFWEYQTAGMAGLRAMVDQPVGRWNNRFVMRSSHLSGFSVEFTKRAIEMKIRRVVLPRGYAEYSEIGSFGIAVTLDFEPNSLAQTFTLHVRYLVGLTGVGHAGRITEIADQAALRAGEVENE